MNIALGIAIVIALIFFIKCSNLREKFKLAKTGKTAAENTAALYFNTLIQYRDIIIQNNLAVPSDMQYSGNEAESKSKFTMDEILDEIAEKGIENVSEEKINFLKNKQSGKK